MTEGVTAVNLGGEEREEKTRSSRKSGKEREARMRKGKVCRRET